MKYVYVSKQIVYHLQDKDDVEVAGTKKEATGFKKGNRNSISSMYYIRCDPCIGVSKAAIRRIPCACNVCIEYIELP